VHAIFTSVMRSPTTRVLLVSDSPDEREMYAESFQRQGYCTLQASNACDGYRLAAELTPAVVITDIKLAGGEDGLGLTREIKRGELARRTRVIVLSGYVFQSHNDAAARAGCDLFLPKPCLPDALIEAVENLLERPLETGGRHARAS
jgi:two-component system, cell cycle response regulator DivK